jgi:hypothetical protein
MAVPAIVNDGNFSIAQPNGAAQPEFPFYSFGDDSTFIQRVNMRVLQSKFIRPPIMQQTFFTGLGKGYLVDIENPQVIAGDLVEYPFVYASLPKQRKEYGSATFTYQARLPGGTTLLSYTDTFPSTIIYDYSVLAPLPPLFRGKVLTSTTDTGAVTIQAGKWVPANTKGLLLAENSTSGIWLGQIFFRRSVYVSVPPIGLVQLNPP